MAEDSTVETLAIRLVGLSGTVMSIEPPADSRLAPTGDWISVQRGRPKAVGGGLAVSSDADLRIYRWDGEEVRRVPGRRVFQRWPEDEDDAYAFSHDGRALLVYRSERREFDLYGLDGRTKDEVVPLSELAPGFAAHEFEFLDVDRIVVWQPEFFGRVAVDWLRVLARDGNGRFVSRVISYETEGRGFIELHGVAPGRGWLLLSAGREPSGVGYDLVDLSGRLVWRHDLTGASDLVRLMPSRDLRRWLPVLLPDGAIRLAPNRPNAKESVVVQLTDVDERLSGRGNTSGRVVVLADDQPLAQVASIVEVPREVAVDGSGQYFLKSFAEGTGRLDAKGTFRRLPEH